ncbi:DUF1015 family protein [Fibrobacter intestinalis]|uniref:Uncharacterized conserved protein, DUF1015 family n=1 Tax=Fibrobacter intestinalis TaxID=28122 RepID=A0A1T4L358_9BACT|nr:MULTISPECIES: DUF1015 family protein [Fibrobacter]PBC73172.1 uncharacterized protein (DUF1015 family) [Fibrobacter sp. NR9]SJZ49144.1 Uncharacterized conserved protein, DUF1015 family [Fibrobacter intestinalis]
MAVARKKSEESRMTRISRMYFNRMFPKRMDALKVALSVFAGVFIGIMPTIGIAIILTVAACAFFKLPKVPGVVSSFVANPLTQFGFFYPSGYYIGKKILQPSAISFDFLRELEGLSFRNCIDVVTRLWNEASGHLLAFLLGITFIALVFGIAFGVAAYFIVSYRKKKHIAIKNKYIQELISEDQKIIKEAKLKGKHMHIFPFKALRPVDPSQAKDISALPYDVMNREEAKEMAKGLPHSYLRITRAELELPDSVEAYDPQVYAHAKENLDKFIADGVIAFDKKNCLYIYRQTMNGREQYGLVCTVPAKDYFDNIIKKHELTRKDKEDDRLRHVLATNSNTGPVFLTYRDQGQFELLKKIIARDPVYDFVTEADGFGHTVWVIDDDNEIEEICRSFDSVPVCYIADGHHRSAAGARAAGYRAAQNPNNRGDEEYNRYLAILFPSTQLKILDYNRVLKDLNGRTQEEFFAELEKVFSIEKLPSAAHPSKQNVVNMYIGGNWYACAFKPEYLEDLGPVDSLDVALLQKLVLKPLFNVDDPRTAKNIDFVGGIRGLGELEKRVDSGECACAFAMYPTTLDQLMAIADAGEIMPPKSTWFEPKLRDGLLVHSLD